MTDSSEKEQLEYFSSLVALIAGLSSVAGTEELAEDDKIQHALKALAEVLSSDCTFIGRCEEDNGRRKIVIESCFPPTEAVGSFVISDSDNIWQAVLDQGTFFAADSEEMDESARQQGIVTAIAAPLTLNDGLQRIIACCNKKESQYPYQTYGSYEGKALDAVAKVLGRRVEQDRVRRNEMEKAARVQKRLLPRETPAIEGIDLDHVSTPAKEVGGDYYDLIPMGGRRIGIVIGDVSGKGLYAALVMVMVRSFVHFVTMRSDGDCPPDELMFQLNNMIHDSVDPGMFVTLIYAVLDTEARSLTYCCAGHLPPLVYRAPQGGFESPGPQSGSLPVGVQPDTMYRIHEIALGQGDIIVLCTDGVTEAARDTEEGKELFEAERLKRVVEKSARKSATKIRDRILKKVRKFTGKSDQDDDTSLIVLKVE